MAKARRPKKPRRDDARKERISMEIVVDCYNEDERATGWYNYLEDKLHTPFLRRCIEERAISPLPVGALESGGPWGSDPAILSSSPGGDRLFSCHLHG
jgi:hypothetical protein